MNRLAKKLSALDWLRFGAVVVVLPFPVGLGAPSGIGRSVKCPCKRL